MQWWYHVFSSNQQPDDSVSPDKGKKKKEQKTRRRVVVGRPRLALTHNAFPAHSLHIHNDPPPSLSFNGVLVGHRHRVRECLQKPIPHRLPLLLLRPYPSHRRAAPAHTHPPPAASSVERGFSSVVLRHALGWLVTGPGKRGQRLIETIPADLGVDAQ